MAEGEREREKEERSQKPTRVAILGVVGKSDSRDRPNRQPNTDRQDTQTPEKQRTPRIGKVTSATAGLVPARQRVEKGGGATAGDGGRWPVVVVVMATEMRSMVRSEGVEDGG